MLSTSNPQSDSPVRQAHHFIKFITDQVNQMVNDELRAERDHTNNKIKLVLDQVGEGLASLTSLINSKDLDQTEKVSDIDLKVNTKRAPILKIYITM